LLSFWITNTTRLLYYLKKDIELVVVTAEQQLNLSELISEIYNLIILDTEKRLSKILIPAILEHEEITGMDQVDFTDDWHRFFRSSSSSSRKSIDTTETPKSITKLLSSTLFVLQSYHVHPIIITQSLAQFFHFISCELFNKILTNKKLLSRSKAMQIRMNFSHLQDWISVNKLPNHLLDYLNPTIQLLQLLQCVSQLQDLMDFINTSKSFDLLNTSQVKRCVVNYRYEVNESRIPEEIEKYAMQCCQDTVRNKQQRSCSFEEEELEKDEDDKDIKETRDSKFMLPFSVPTTTHMVSFHHWDHTKSNGREIIPIIPEEWMDKLDKPSSSIVA
jgi:hypothetical protein